MTTTVYRTRSPDGEFHFAHRATLLASIRLTYSTLQDVRIYDGGDEVLVTFTRNGEPGEDRFEVEEVRLPDVVHHTATHL